MTTAERPSLLEQIKSATWHHHRQLEILPFVSALSTGTLPLESYVAQLRGLAVIMVTIEQCLAESRNRSMEQLRPLLKSRYSMICSDLSFYAPRTVPDLLPAVKWALATAVDIRLTAAACPDKLLGFLYVLEGTTRGNQVHLPDIVRCFDLAGKEGATFYHGYGDETAVHWEEFCTVLNSAADEIDPALMQMGVEQMYDALESFHTLLYPVPEAGLGFTATALNPEAGNHPVPQDARIIAAALRAGECCRREFSYYERRYGERGRRFTASDAAWLATLVHLPEALAADQVLWLSRILAVRGMPLLLMERQLELLIDELGTLVSTGSLQTVLAGMRNDRGRVLPQLDFDLRCRQLEKELESQLIDFADLPIIITAAWCDGLSGIPECPASLHGWLQGADILSGSQLMKVQNILDDCHD